MKPLLHLITLSLLQLASTSLLVNFTGGQDVSRLGSPQLEGQNPGDRIEKGNSSIFIETEKDPAGRSSLHFHRDAHFRRAEVHALGQYSRGKNYFVGYHFMLTRSYDKLMIFQWKKDSETAAPIQVVPFNVKFCGASLCVRYEPPSPDHHHLKPPQVLWTDKTDLALNKPHKIELAWDTHPGGNNKLTLWRDGEKMFTKTGIDLWTGNTYPKFGLYRGEKLRGERDPDGDHVFDNYIYRVQISDKSLDEVSEVGGEQPAPDTAWREFDLEL